TEIKWSLLAELQIARVKPLIPPSFGPYALMIECPPHTVINLPGAPYGRYEVVTGGSASVSSLTLLPLGLRYVPGGKEVDPMEAGPDGATLMVLAFDSDAREGGLKGDKLSFAAAAAMERAI